MGAQACASGVETRKSGKYFQLPFPENVAPDRETPARGFNPPKRAQTCRIALNIEGHPCAQITYREHGPPGPFLAAAAADTLADVDVRAPKATYDGNLAPYIAA